MGRSKHCLMISCQRPWPAKPVHIIKKKRENKSQLEGGSHFWSKSYFKLRNVHVNGKSGTEIKFIFLCPRSRKRVKGIKKKFICIRVSNFILQSFCHLWKKKNHEERNSTLAKPYLITEILFIAIYIEVALIIYFFIIL